MTLNCLLHSPFQVYEELKRNEEMMEIGFESNILDGTDISGKISILNIILLRQGQIKATFLGDSEAGKI